MLQFAAIFLAHMSSPALAEEPYERVKPWRYEKYLGSIDEVIHNGATELPLYNSFKGRPGSLTALPFENAEGKSREWLTLFSSSLPYIVVSSDFANYMGAKIQTTNKKLIPIWEEYKLGGQVDYAVFDELVIGNMTLRNVTAVIRDYEKGAEYVDGFDSNVHMIIGFNQLESAYQILPSQGSIKFEGTADGSALMSEYGGAIGYQNYTGGKLKFLKRDTITPSVVTMIEANVDGETQKLLIETATFNSIANIEAGTETHLSRDINMKQSSIVFGTVKTETMTESFAMDWKLTPYNGVIGQDILNSYDIAVDIGNQQIAFKPVRTAQKRLSFIPTQLAQVQAKIDEKLNAEPAEGEDAPEMSAADWSELMSFQLQLGELETAYASALKRTELEPENCTFWLDASQMALTLNKASEAKDFAQKSSDLYHAWWSIDLYTRQDIQARQDKMKAEDQDAAKEAQKALAADAETQWHYPQSGSCHEADAQLAWSLIANDELEAVLPVYREKLDLDENLAFATAYSAILQNDMPLAQEALRQGLKLGKGYSSIAEAGLALWYADIGDTEQYQSLMRATQTSDSLYHALEIDNYRQIHGSDKTLSYLKNKVAKDPDDCDDQYLYVRELKLAGAGEAYDQAVTQAERAFKAQINMVSPDQPLTNVQYNMLNSYARFLILTDRIEEAEGIINNRLQKQTFANGYLALTLADYHAYKGDMDSAMAEIAKLKLDGLDILSLSSAMLLRAPASASAE